MITDTSENDEKQLLLKVAGGDERAFRTLFEKYHGVLATHIMRITRLQESTEEIVQDVFLKIWMSRETLSDIHDIRSYLYIVSKNHALDSLKKTARERVTFSDADWNLVEKSLVHTEPEDSVPLGLIDEAIDRLPPQQKKVYLLSRRERKKYSEIAEQLGISRETVKKYLQLATVSISTYILDNTSICISSIIFLFI
jgi:RNA polymerase sigma-70 factor (family 1)